MGAVRPQGPFDREIDGAGCVLMPGLVNAHTHVPMTAMRGYGDGNNLQDWLHNYIFPVEAKWDDRAIRSCAALGLAEMIAAGTTCIADMYMHTGAIAQEVAAAGISANLSVGGVYFGAPEDFSPDACGDCANQRRLTEEWHGYNNGQILVDASIHGEYTSSAPLWQWMADYAHEKGLGLHIHVSETQAEHAECIAATERPRYRFWMNTASGTAGPLPPTVSTPPRRIGPLWPPRGSPPFTTRSPI